QEDITERRRTMEALAASEREYRRLVDTASEGIWAVDADHRTTFVNERLEAMLGYTAAELLGRPVIDFTDEEGSGIAEASRLRRRQGIREQLDFKLRRRDGSTFWVLMSTAPIVDEQGQYAGALAMVTDLTSRRQAEAALRGSEAWFRALIEEQQDLTAVVAADGTFKYASPSFERILGHHPSDLVGRLAFELIHPDDHEAVVRVFEEGLLQPGVVRALRYRYRHKDGTWRVIDGIGRNLVDDTIIGGVVINSRDVTERVALEAQFLQAQKMELVGLLVAGVAHDFNNILAVILGASDMLREDLSPGHPSLGDVAEIRAAAERASALTRQLLAFSRQQILEPLVFDLSELVRNIDKMLRRVLGDNVTLATRLSATPTLVKADPGQLEQVLLNLAVNSRDAMPEGGQLTIETATVELSQSHPGWHVPMRPGPHVLLTVSDTGIGMSKEIQARVFEPFYTTKALGKGTGLGLSTVYGIIKQSEGFIWLYSEPGRGTSFKIYLPQARGDVLPMPPRSSAPEPLGGSETVLIVDDAAAVRLFARRALERHGYTVLEADGADALELARGFPGTIHLLLTDVVMPGISGPDLARALNQLQSELRVLFMSGFSDAAMRAKLAAAGGAFLQKPFAVADLARKVREVLDFDR
ncbi:MAG: PAS domain S-box protein, partial [Gemmatimonadota bacterium]